MNGFDARTWPKMLRWGLWSLLAVLAAGMGLRAIAVLFYPDRLLPDLLLPSFMARPEGIYPHALFGGIGIMIGPLQFLRSVRRRWLGVHRTLGKLYVAVGMVTGVSGLYMAAHSHGGMATHLGFGGLGVALLFTTGMAFWHIRHGRVAPHRRWMIRSYATMFAAVTIRMWIPPMEILFGGGFTPAYRIASWLGWVVNLGVVELYIRRS